MNDTQNTTTTEPQDARSELRDLLRGLESAHTDVLICIQDMLDLMHFLDTFFTDETFEPNSSDTHTQLSALERIKYYSHYRGLNCIIHNMGRDIENKAYAVGDNISKAFEIAKYSA
ncbi:MAG: hypothetical protein IJY93_01360 [Clostridia bacterium]|nr:hypothetical protein [Clostridia bacterium]